MGKSIRKQYAKIVRDRTVEVWQARAKRDRDAKDVEPLMGLLYDSVHAQVVREAEWVMAATLANAERLWGTNEAERMMNEGIDYANSLTYEAAKEAEPHA